MFLDYGFLWEIGGARASGINIFCEKSERKQVAEFFKEKMEIHWKEAQDIVWEQYGPESKWKKEQDRFNKINESAPDEVVDCYDMKNPTSVCVTNKGVFVKFKATLVLDYSKSIGGVKGTVIEGKEALEKTLNELLSEYPEISYDGYVGFESTHADLDHCVFQCEISSKENRVVFDETDRIYDFVGEALAVAMRKDKFWEKFNDHLKLCFFEREARVKGILKNIYSYSEWISIDAYNRILEGLVQYFSEVIFESDFEKKISPELNEIFEDLKKKKGNTLENIKEKELTSEFEKQIKDELAILTLKITEVEKDINKQIEKILKLLGERNE